MAGRPATISDLFTPMQSIQTCMEKNAEAVDSGIKTLNESVLGCASSMGTASKVFKKSVDTFRVQVGNSLKSFRKMNEKSIANAAEAVSKAIAGAMGGVAAASAAAASASAAPMGMIAEGMQQNAITMTNMLNEVVSIGKTVSQIKKSVKKNAKGVSPAAKLKEGAAPKKEEAPKKEKGSKFQGLKDLGDAASAFKDISLKDAIMMKMKVKRVLAAAREMEDFGKGFDAKNAEALAKTLKTLGESAASFIVDLGKVMVLAPFAMATAAMLKPTISLVASAVEPIADEDVNKYDGAAATLYDLAIGVSKFVARLALVTPLAPIAIIGAALLNPIISLTVKAIEPIADENYSKYDGAADTLDLIAGSSLKFTAAMALNTILAPIAMVGAALFGLLLLETKFVFGIVSDKQTQKDLATGSDVLEGMGSATLKFTASMALSVIFAPIAMVGVALSALVVGGSASLFSSIGNKQTSQDIRRGAWTVEVMSLAILGFTLSMLATTMILRYMITGGGEKVDWMNVVAVASILPMFGVMVGSAFVFKKIGDNWADITLGSFAVAIMSVATVMFSLSLLVTYMITKSIVGDVFSDGKFDMQNVAALACIVPVFGLMLGANAVYKRLGDEKSVRKTLMGGLSIIVMSISLISFAGAMWVTHQMTKNIVKNGEKADLLALTLDVAVFALMLGGNYVFRRLGKESTVKKTIAGGVSVIAMSVGLVTFAGAMWVTHQMTKNIISNANGADIGAVIADVAVFALMLGGNYIFRRLGKDKTVKDSLKGLVSIAAMSAGIIMFSGAMWVSHKIAKKIVGDADAASIVTTLGIFALMVGSVFIFKFAGGALADIAKGTAGMILMAVGIGAFGFGLSFFTDAVKDCKWWQLIALPALVLAFGVEFAALGIPMVAGFVALGSAAVAAMGLAMIPFGYGLGKYAGYVKEAGLDLKTVGEMAGLLMLFGIEFSLLGPLSPLIAMADVAMGIMGVTLIVFGKGIGSYANSVRESKIDWKTLGKMAGLIALFGVEFAAIGPLSPLILAADAAIGIMGGSLLLIGKGVGEYAGAINKSKVNVKTIITMAGIIGTFALEFSALALVSGFIATGSAAAAAMGGALLSMGKGLQEFAAAKLNPKSIKVFSEMMITLRDTFAVMAGSGEASGKGGILGSFIRGAIATFTPSGVEKGIAVSKKMGEALYSIAKGLVQFQNGIGDQITDKQFMKDFADSVSTTVSSIATAFETVGNSWTTKKSPKPHTIFGKLFRDMTFGLFDDKTKNAVEEGIKAVRGMGDSLKDIANGLKEYKDLVPNEKDAGWVGQVGSNIALMLDALVEPLRKFGTTEEDINVATAQASSINQGFGAIEKISASTMNYNSKKVDIARAMENVGQIGTLISGMAQGIKTFAEIDPKKDIGSAFDIDDDWHLTGNGGGMIGNIQQMLCGFFPAFILMGKKLYETGTFDEVVEAAKYEDHWYGSRKTQDAKTEKKSYVGMAIEAASGIGGIIRDFAEGMKMMNEAYPDSSKLTTGVGNVIRAISAVFTGFGTIGYKVKTGAGGIEPVLPNGMGSEFNFGLVDSRVTYILRSDNSNRIADLSSAITEAVKGFGESMKTLKDQMPTATEVNKNMQMYMLTLMNISSSALVMSDHTAADTALIYDNKGITSYQLTNLNANMLSQANSNAKEMKSIMGYVSGMSKTADGLSDTAGKKFTTFATQLTSGMNTLASAKNNITSATAFMATLIKAKNNNVFDNIATNTERIAQAFNSINSNIMKPYAEMIAGMGEMAKRTGATKSVLDDVRDLIVEMIENIKELGSVKVEYGKKQETVERTDKTGGGVQNVKVDTTVSLEGLTAQALNNLAAAIREKL